MPAPLRLVCSHHEPIAAPPFLGCSSGSRLFSAVAPHLSLLGVLLIWSVTLLAQHQLGTPDGPVFRASTDLVTIDAVVMDRDGKPVTNLTREDFEVTVAGKHQTLEQAVYIRTQEQPQALAAVRAAAIPRGGNVPAEPRSESAASQALRSTEPRPTKSHARSRLSWTISASRSKYVLRA